MDLSRDRSHTDTAVIDDGACSSRAAASCISLRNDAASDGLTCEPPWWSDLDSENGGERSLFEHPLTSRLVASAGIDRRRADLIPGDRNGVIRAWHRCTAPYVLP